MKKLIALLLLLFSTAIFADNSTNFSDFYTLTSGGWEYWTIVIGGGVVSVLLAFFTAGAATPVFVSVLWGIGGAAGEYTIDNLYNDYQHSSLVESSEDLPTLPFPINVNGTKLYQQAVTNLKNIKPDEIGSPNSRKKIYEQIERLKHNDLFSKSQALLALLYFMVNDYEQAKHYSSKFIQQHPNSSLPEFIYAVSNLYDEQVLYHAESFNFFEKSILSEPDNKFIPLMFSIYLDRYILRFGVDTAFFNDMYDLTLSAPFKAHNLTILLSQYIILLKQEQQKITVLTTTDNTTIKQSPATLAVAEQSFNNYFHLIYHAKKALGVYLKIKPDVSYWRKVTRYFSEEPKVSLEKLQGKYSELIAKYEGNRKQLKSLVDDFEDYQNDISKEKTVQPTPSKNNAIKWAVSIVSILLIIGLIFAKRRKILFNQYD
jgi:tetratricopeptide (TPR) repeat protein